MIQFEQLIPQPLAGTDLSASGLWASNKQVITEGNSCLIHSPSGRGKTSFLSFVYGLRKDFTGELEVLNKKVKDYSPAEWEHLRQRKLSAVFQGLRLFPTLSALENIELKNNLTNYKSKQEIEKLADNLEVAPFLKQPLATLSFGQQQRIALIRALCQPFELLLMDEPFSHIDKDLQLKVWELVCKEQKERNASLLITLLHPIDFVETDQIITI